MTAFKAYSKHGSIVKDTPRQAAIAFFEAYPKARTCTVTQGKIEQMGGMNYFVSVHGTGSKRYPDVSKKTALDLPDIQPA